ncbi:hypothetical protein [Streptomyces sp. NPDC047315]|uniref:hypothetical protein n=1 Tax=Streptomyces sp. NPDC047315 TaxID=3155142 RepID=UPI0033D7B7FC
MRPAVIALRTAGVAAALATAPAVLVLAPAEPAAGQVVHAHDTPPPASAPLAAPAPPAPTAEGLATEHPRSENTGPSTPHTVVGFVLAGVAAVVVTLRGARRRRRPDADGHVHR